MAVDSNIAPVSSKDFLDIQAITECRFTLTCMLHTKTLKDRTDKYSLQSSIIKWPVWQND